MKKLIAWASVLVLAGACFAEPTITGVMAQQRYPWNGKVDISYTASGVTAAAEARGLKPAIKVMAIDRSTTPWTTNVADAAALFVGPLGIEKLTDAAALADGAHRIVWDMNAQGLPFTSEDTVFAVSGEGKVPVPGGVQLWENGPYWAECNVGATKPEEYGYYFWWGDTVGYKRNSDNDGWISVKDGTSFSFTDCPTFGKSNSQLLSAGYIDSSGNLVAAHDAATTWLGAPWRMPTEAEFEALVDNCTTSWITTNGISGQLVTGKGVYASKSIFLPSAGYGVGPYCGMSGSYWSSMPDSDDSDLARYLHLDSDGIGVHFSGCRWFGDSVRPLRESVHAETFCTGESGQVRVDLTTGTRVANITQLLTCSTEWVDGAGAGAMAVVSVDDAILGEASGSGIIRWTPAMSGEHTLTHKVMLGDTQIGETLTATFFVPGEEKGFVISFVAPNGESSIQAAYFATNRPYGRLPLARREGCTFAGWYTTLDGTTRVGAFDDVLPDVKTLYARWVEDDAALYAQWDPNHYSAVFNAGGGTGEMDAQPFIYDQTQALSANAFKKTGYAFKGWATNEAGEVVYADKQAVSNLTAEAGFAVALFAKWEQLMDITEEEIEEWVVYDIAPTYKKSGEKAIDYVKRFKERFGDDYTTAFCSETGKTGQDGEALCVYHDYIAGTDPLDKNSQFKADITFDASGKPVVTYKPVLSKEKTALRIYTTHGKQDLADEWSVVAPGQEADYRFFKVTIQMRPKN